MEWDRMEWVQHALKGNAPHFGRDVITLVADVDEVKL